MCRPSSFFSISIVKVKFKGKYNIIVFKAETVQKPGVQIQGNYKIVKTGGVGTQNRHKRPDPCLLYVPDKISDVFIKHKNTNDRNRHQYLYEEYGINFLDKALSHTGICKLSYSRRVGEGRRSVRLGWGMRGCAGIGRGRAVYAPIGRTNRYA